jgi:hypothetical protein
VAYRITIRVVQVLTSAADAKLFVRVIYYFRLVESIKLFSYRMRWLRAYGDLRP